jgi:hypothetical protein
MALERWCSPTDPHQTNHCRAVEGGRAGERTVQEATKMEHMNSVSERSRRRRRSPLRRVTCTMKNDARNTTHPPNSNASLHPTPSV